MSTDAPAPAGGWVPKCLVGAFGDNGDVFCRACIEKDPALQRRLEYPREDEFSLKIIADDDTDSFEWVPAVAVAGHSVHAVREANRSQTGGHVIDEDEVKEPNDGNYSDMSGEPDLSRLRLVGPEPALSVESIPAGAAAVEQPVPGLTLVSYPKGNEAPREATATDRVLFGVRRRRQLHDEREGYFRDYKDGTGRPSDALDVIAATNAHDEAVKAVRVTWRHKLNVALANALAETNEKRLPEKLTEVAAIVTAWQEAIELRGSKARILAEQGAVKHVQRADGSWKKVHLMPWWRRLLKALRISS